MSPVVTTPPPEAKLIRERRGRRSARQCAMEADVSPTWWREVERGIRRAGADSLAKMARAVWITPDELAGTGRDDAAADLIALLDAGPEDVTRDEVRALADRIAKARSLTEGQKRALAGKLLDAIDGNVSQFDTHG